MKNIFKMYVERSKRVLQNYKTAKWNSEIKKHFPNQNHVIEFAFEVAGVPYYSFSDVYAIPFERGLMSLAVYEQCKTHCSREYLLLFADTLKKILSENRIDIFKIKELQQQLEERLRLPSEVNLLYSLASVMFFDTKENPCVYDAEYNRKKIEFWKMHKGVNDFFLQKPLLDLMPFLNSQNLDLDIYFKLNSDLNAAHEQALRLLQSSN